MPSVSNSSSTSNSSSGIDLAARALGQKDYMQAFNEASTNTGRIGELSAGRQAAYAQEMNRALEQMLAQGGSSRNRIYRDAKAQTGSVGAGLAGTGLYNSTVKGNMEQAVARDRDESLLALDDTLRNQIMAIMMQRAEGQDRISSDQIGAESSSRLAGADILSQRAAYSPTRSNSLSNSQTKSLSDVPLGVINGTYNYGGRLGTVINGRVLTGS